MRVPQGSIVAPLLCFYFYLNSLSTKTENSNILLFADDDISVIFQIKTFKP